MSSLRFSGGRWAFIAAPLLLYGCFVAGDDGGNEDGDGSSGCQSDADCRNGRVCVDVDGNRDNVCDPDERCSCASPGSGGDGNSVGGSGGDANGGATTGGNVTGGNATGGATTGGATTGGAMNGGATTGGNATGGNATGGRATGGAGMGGSSTGGSSGAGVCGPYCDRLVGAMCSSVTPTSCATECNSLAMDCPAEASAVRTCVANPANTISCVSGAPAISGCDDELDARDRCLICVPETGDGTCNACSKTTCCAELGDYGLASDGQSFYSCANACTTQACLDACISQFPVAGAAFGDLVDCQDTDCAEPCICEVTASDDACSTCYKRGCCPETVIYTTAPDIGAFEDCAVPCTSNDCINACIDQFPEAGAAFVAWSDCLYVDCNGECG